MNLSHKRAGLTVLILAIILRLLAITVWNSPYFEGLDQSEYLALAQNLRMHGIFSFGAVHPWGASGVLNSTGPFLPTAARAPFYPLVIASLWWGSEPPILEIQILQALLGGVIAYLVYSTALSLTNRRTALIAGFLMAFAPLSCFMTSTIMSETLFTFLLTFGVWLWSKQRGFLAGVIFGAGSLTRPVLLPFLGLIAVGAVIFRFNRVTHAKIVLGAIILIFPWTIRNVVTQHTLILISTQGWGSNLLFGTIDVPYGSSVNPWLRYSADPAVKSIVTATPTETDAEGQMFRVAIDRVRQNPVRWFFVRLKQFPRLLLDLGGDFFTLLSPGVIKFVFLIKSLIFIGLSMLGGFLMRREWKQYYYLALFPIFMLIVQFPAWGEPRYMVPTVPMLTIFAALPLSARLLKSNPPSAPGHSGDSQER